MMFFFHSEKNLQILHSNYFSKAINIMRQGLTLEYGNDCASHGNWNVVVITAKGLGTVFVKKKIFTFQFPSNRGLAQTGLFATENEKNT
jgi:hypothetical protein